MNYLDLTNEVLKRLRENQVSSLFENTQSTVVTTFVNDALRQVEEAHDWSALRQEIVIGTSASVDEYSLTGTQNRATIIDVRNITDSYPMREMTSAYRRRIDLADTLGNSAPRYYSLEGVDSSGDDIIKFWPVPDGNYVINVYCCVRSADLAAEGDEIVVPHQPVILYATAMAAQERGGVDSGDRHERGR